MERVQYQLERSIPQLRLLEEHKVFSKEELRSVVSQRQAFESRLLRRGSDYIDYFRYIELEENLERLIKAKAKRLGLPRSFHHANSASHTGHIISILERLVLKFKDEPQAWRRYITYAHDKKMRVISGRVTARALALHTDDVNLWLEAAFFELNENSSTTAARSLLQRALRLNQIPWTTKPSQAASGPVRLQLSFQETDVVRLWIGYIRMELVFVERLRRRWLVLGLQWDSDEQQPAGPVMSNDSTEAIQAAVDIDASNQQNSSENHDDTEQTLLDQVPVAEQASQPISTAISAPRTLAAIPPSQVSILRGDIPLFLISSALQSLAPSLHFALLVSLRQLFGDFPFAESTDPNAYRSGEALRNRLLQSVESILRDQQRWTWDHFTPVALFASTHQICRLPGMLSDSQSAKAEQIANQEELESHKNLRASSRSKRSLEEFGMDGLIGWCRSEEDRKVDPAQLVHLVLLQSFQFELTEPNTGKPTPLFSRLANSGSLPSAIRNLVEYMRSLCTQAPIQGSTTKIHPKSDFYTATVLLLEMLATPSKSGIDEPNLRTYLESVKSQLLKEARAAGPGIESAHMRAKLLRRNYDAAIADQTPSNKLAKVVQDLTEATAKTQFPSSEELWLLRIQAQTRLLGESDPDAIAREWKAGLTACSESVDVNFADHAWRSIWSLYTDWLDSMANTTNKTTSQGKGQTKKAKLTLSFDKVAVMYQWAVRETGSYLSRAESGPEAEKVHKYRQDIHDHVVTQYFDLAAKHGKEAETCNWLLRFSFATPPVWVMITTILSQPSKNRVPRSRMELADKIWAKLMQSDAATITKHRLPSNYLQHLAFHDMPEALVQLQRFETMLSETEYADLQFLWQQILNLVEQVGPTQLV